MKLCVAFSVKHTAKLVIFKHGRNSSAVFKIIALVKILCFVIGDPAQVLQLYLSVGTKGLCTTEENGTFHVRDFEVNSKFHPVNTMARGKKVLMILIFPSSVRNLNQN